MAEQGGTTEGGSESSAGQETTSSGEVIIRAPVNGQLDYNSWAKAVKAPSLEEREDGDTEDEDISEDSSDAEEVEEEAEEGEGSEDDSAEGEDEVPLEEVKTDSKYAVKVKLKDGKVVTIPPDATILHQVDGELKEINLKEALDREAGELTIQQRFSKLAEVERVFKQEKSQLTQQLETYKAKAEGQESFVAQLVEQSKVAPENALCMLAEHAGKMPGDVYEEFINHCFGVVQAIKEKGLTPQDLQVQYRKIDKAFLLEKNRLREENENRQKTQSTRLAKRKEKFNDIINSKGVAFEVLEAAIPALAKEEAFTDSEEENLKRIEAKALYLQREKWLDAELTKSKVANQESVREAILGIISNGDWSKAEVEELVKQSKTLVPTPKGSNTLSKAQAVPNHAKKKPMIVRSTADLQRLFKVGKGA